MAPLSGSSSSIRSRNFSRITGFRMYQYEFSYEGSLYQKLVSRCSVYLRVAEDTLDSYSKYEPSIFNGGPVDGTFELFSIFFMRFTLDELKNSVFLMFEDETEDFRSIIEDSDLVRHLLDVLRTSDFNIISCYADYSQAFVDNSVDMFDFHLTLG